MSCSTSGRRVTIPVPRGKKSRPTMFLKKSSFDCTAVEGGAYLEYTTLAAALTTEHADLRKVYLGS